MMMDVLTLRNIVYGWDGVWLDWGWLGSFGSCGVGEVKNFILLIIQDINCFVVFTFQAHIIILLLQQQWVPLKGAAP